MYSERKRKALLKKKKWSKWFTSHFTTENWHTEVSGKMLNTNREMKKYNL